MEFFEFTSKEAAAPMMSVAAPLWFWISWKTIQNFGEKIQNFGFCLKIMESFEKLRVMSSKVGGKF